MAAHVAEELKKTVTYATPPFQWRNEERKKDRKKVSCKVEPTFLVNWSPHAMRILHGVAGVSNRK